MHREEIEVENVSIKNIDKVESLCNLCLSRQEKNDPHFIEGGVLRRRWVKENNEKYGSVGKIAFHDSEPIGLIQYIPKPMEKVVEVKCIFVPEKVESKEDVGEKLLDETVKEFKGPKSFLDGDKVKALVTYNFSNSKNYPNLKFYEENGFKQVPDIEADLWYYPLEDDYVYEPRGECYRVEEKDLNKALLFCNSSCPLCVYEMDKTMREIQHVSPNLPIKIVIPYEEDKLRSICSTPLCIINESRIEPAFMERETFDQKLREALEHLKAHGDEGIPDEFEELKT